MNPSHCPLCYAELEVRDVAPCTECGGFEQELEHLRAGKHTYAELRIFGDLSLVLCNFCMVDFGSRDPTFFGLLCSARIGYEKMQFLRDSEPKAAKDKFCTACGHRLAFLEFVAKARELHGEQQ
jgi:hypothetical protein